MPPGQPSPRRLPTLRIALVVLVLVGLIGAALVADGLRLKVGQAEAVAVRTPVGEARP